MNLSISVVSHRQAQLVSQLLGDLAAVGTTDMEVLVTLNVPEPSEPLERTYPFPLKIIRNDHRKGFGANHNAAYALARRECFAVVNPDIRLTSNPFPPLCEAAMRPGTGVAAPKVLSSTGSVEDSVRRFPTVGSLALKAFARSVRPDYPLTGKALRPDWVAGMFMVFARPAFAAVGGFDERYFLYYEDVDLCWRLRRAGYEVVLLPEVSVVHDARRDSRRRPAYLRHHLAGMTRFLLTRALAPRQR